MVNPEKKLSGGDAKVEEYVRRIQSGESSEEIMRGLPDSFRKSIEARLNRGRDAEEEFAESDSISQEARQKIRKMAQEDKINSTNRANEIRVKLGIPIQSIEQSPADALDTGLLSEEKQKARDVKAIFDAMSEALKGAGLEKVKEYDERLRAAMAGKPIKIGDTVANLMSDFKRFTRIDWTPDFNFDKLFAEDREKPKNYNDVGSQELSTEKKAKLIEELRQKYNDIKSKKRMTLEDQMFMVSHGINPENNEAFPTVDGSIGINYDAHGVAKSQQLEQLLNLLDNGISKDRDFYTAPFEVPVDIRPALTSVLGAGGGTAYKDGLAVLTSGYKETIKDNGIKHVFINDVFLDLKELLEKAYPQYQFHLLSEQKAVLEGEAIEAEKRN